MIVQENINISYYNRLLAFLKQKAKGYVPKKSKVLTGEQVLQFIANAPDEIHLLHKVRINLKSSSINNIIIKYFLGCFSHGSVWGSTAR